MFNRVTIVLILCCLSLFGCKRNAQNYEPKTDTTYASEMTTGRIEDYGCYYAAEGLPQHVFALDLYSDGLQLIDSVYGQDTITLMVGSGTNLYFSDVFLPDSLNTLEGGTYRADTTGAPFTFLPGKTFEGNFTGAYLLRVEQGKLLSHAILPSGSITLSYSGDTINMQFAGKISERQNYSATFSGILKTQKRNERRHL